MMMMNITNSYLQDDYEDQYLPFHIREYVHPLDDNDDNDDNDDDDDNDDNNNYYYIEKSSIYTIHTQEESIKIASTTSIQIPNPSSIRRQVQSQSRFTQDFWCDRTISIICSFYFDLMNIT